MLEHLLEHRLMTGAIAMKVKVQKIGNSLGVILPKEVLARQRIDAGAALSLSEGPNGMFLSIYNDELEEELAIGDSFMREHRNVFKALAK
jgi:putative addiction module antidote